MKRYRSSGFVVTLKGTSIVKSFMTMILFMFFIFSLSGLLTALKPEYRPTSSSVHVVANHLTGDLLYGILGFENHYFLQSLPEEAKWPSISRLLFKLSTNISLDDPRSLLGRELPGFSLFDGKIVVAGEGTKYTNMPIESAPPIEVLEAEREAALQNLDQIKETPTTPEAEVPPTLTTGDKKVLFVYFTHTRESYLPYLKGVTDPNAAHHSKINVTQIGDKLKEEMEKRGIGTEVNKTDVMTILGKKGLTYGSSYQESRPIVEAAVTANRDLQYFFDIHRDARRKKDTTKEINGVNYAKLAFVIGAEHSNYEKNLKLATELHKKLEKKYPGLSRGIIEKKGKDTNGKFNQDLSHNAILLEFGGVDNTFDELYRSAAALSDVFSEYYWQAESVSTEKEQTTNGQ